MSRFSQLFRKLLPRRIVWWIMRSAVVKNSTEHFSTPGSVSMKMNTYIRTGAAPGCLLRGGGRDVSLLLREAKNFAPALKKKVAQRGGGGGGVGDSDTFFFRLKNFFNITFHNGVGGVVSSWPWLTAELTSGKKNHRGAIFPLPGPPPPPRGAATWDVCYYAQYAAAHSDVITPTPARRHSPALPLV